MLRGVMIVFVLGLLMAFNSASSAQSNESFEDLVRDMFILRLAELDRSHFLNSAESGEKQQDLSETILMLRIKTIDRSNMLNKFVSKNAHDFSKLGDNCETLQQDLQYHIVFTSQYLVQLNIYEDTNDDRVLHFQNSLKKHKLICPEETRLNILGQSLFRSVWKTSL